MARRESDEKFPTALFIDSANAAYIEHLHARYENDPDSVSQQWRTFFEALADDPEAVKKAAQHTSWTPGNWPQPAGGDLVAALDGNWPQATPDAAGQPIPRGDAGKLAPSRTPPEPAIRRAVSFRPRSLPSGKMKDGNRP